MDSLQRTDTHLNLGRVFQQFRESHRIRFAVMVGVEIFWFERLCRIGHHLRGHRIGQIHRQEGTVDVLQGLHFRYIFGIARHVNALVAKGQHIAVANTLWMKGLAVVPLMKSGTLEIGDVV